MPIVLLIVSLFCIYSLSKSKEDRKLIFKIWIPKMLIVLSPLIVFDILCYFLNIQPLGKEHSLFVYRQILVLLSMIISLLGFIKYFENMNKDNKIPPLVAIFFLYFGMRTASLLIPFGLYFIP